MIYQAASTAQVLEQPSPLIVFPCLVHFYVTNKFLTIVTTFSTLPYTVSTVSANAWSSRTNPIQLTYINFQSSPAIVNCTRRTAISSNSVVVIASLYSLYFAVRANVTLTWNSYTSPLSCQHEIFKEKNYQLASLAQVALQPSSTKIRIVSGIWRILGEGLPSSHSSPISILPFPHFRQVVGMFVVLQILSK